MTDRYGSFAASTFGKKVVKSLGLPNPVSLHRATPGAPALLGPVAVNSPNPAVDKMIDGVLTYNGLTRTQAGASPKLGGVVVDVTGLKNVHDLTVLHSELKPLMRQLTTSARIIVLATTAAATTGVDERVCAESIRGFIKSVAKEIGKGGTANAIFLDPAHPDAAASTLAFFLSGRSAFVSGQIVSITAGATAPALAPANLDLNTADQAPTDAEPLTGKVALVTGSSRGLGASMAQVLAARGATVVGVDIPVTAPDLATQATALGGSFLPVDVTAPDSGLQMAQHCLAEHGGLDIIVHNAGITRDKKLANMSEDHWRQTIAVNLAAPLRITGRLIAEGALRRGGRVIGVASISGIAGNAGQSNYAASKSGVVGMVQALTPECDAADITVNAVAPGFIETEMTAKIPPMIREVGRRLSSLAQGGQPVDVAETVAWLADPASAAIRGQVVRVCGQNLLGA